jgi:8-oxo-dGTP diphosphatase
MPRSHHQITRVAAYGLVVEAERILLCRISQQLPQDRGLWTLPGGGIEFGEDPADAMVREVQEETGLIVCPTRLAGLDSIVIEGPESTFHGIRLLYFTTILGGELSYEVDGTTDQCGWHRLEEARSLPIVDLVEAGLDLLLAKGHTSHD